MLASSSPRAQELAKRLTAFMEEHVYPAEAVFERQLAEATDRWAELPITAELKAKAKAAKLWNLWLPKAHYEEGPDQSRLCAALRDHGALADRAGKLQLLGARHRQHGDADPVRQRRAEEALAAAA